MSPLKLLPQLHHLQQQEKLKCRFCKIFPKLFIYDPIKLKHFCLHPAANSRCHLCQNLSHLLQCKLNLFFFCCCRSEKVLLMKFSFIYLFSFRSETVGVRSDRGASSRWAFRDVKLCKTMLLKWEFLAEKFQWETMEKRKAFDVEGWIFFWQTTENFHFDNVASRKRNLNWVHVQFDAMFAPFCRLQRRRSCYLDLVSKK